jgi:hypothetical protein
VTLRPVPDAPSTLTGDCPACGAYVALVLRTRNDAERVAAGNASGYIGQDATAESLGIKRRGV